METINKPTMTTEASEIAQALKAGKVALVPTDTVYGLAASPLHPDAVAGIFRIKQRPQNVNLPIMVAEKAQLEDLGLDVNKAAQTLLASSYMPGPMTLVLGFLENGTRPSWLEGRDEVAVRIPNSEFMLQVLREAGPALVTSANKHKSKINMGVLSEVLNDLEEYPPIASDGGVLRDTASTIVNCRKNPVVIEREGVVAKEQVFELLSA